MTLEKLLRDHNLRKTRARVAILTELLSCCCPLTVSQLRSAVGETAFDKATIYRELSLLEAKGIICSTTLDNRSQSFELASDDHAHHLVCLKCGEIDKMTMPNDLDAHENKIRASKNFDVVRHCLEFYGYCATCQKV